MNTSLSKTILVTGAAGFIGSHAVDRLLMDGHRVIGIDNLTQGTLLNLTEAEKNPQFSFIQHDIQGLVALEETLKEFLRDGIDMVWHLAANSDIQGGVENPNVDLKDTYLTTFHILALMKKYRITEIVFASTSAIYGERIDVLSEDSGPFFPISNYGAMKLASEASISAALESFLEKAWIFRFPNVVGSRATHGAIYDFVAKLKTNPAKLEVLGDGTQIKPYLHVSELLDAMFFVIENSTDALSYFNIGQAESRSTVAFMAETVRAVVSPEAQISYTGEDRGWVGDVPQFQLSIEKIERLGWKPQMSSDESVKRAVSECI